MRVKTFDVARQSGEAVTLPRLTNPTSTGMHCWAVSRTNEVLERIRQQCQVKGIAMDPKNNIVFSDEHTHDHAALPHVAILVFQSAGLALVLFLIAGLWHLLGFEPAFIAILVCCVLGVGAWLFSQGRHHIHDIADRKHMRELASQAIANHHSIEYKPATRELRTISPFTIQNGPLTIKDINLGNAAQLAPVLSLPEKILAIDVMRKWHLTPDNLFLALGKGSKELACSLEGLMHVAHDAPTGQGKTAQWKAEIVQLLKLDVQVVLCNPHFAPVDKKGNDWRPIGQAIEAQGWLELAPGLRIPGLIRKYETIVNMLKWLSLKEIDRRFTLQAQGDYSYKPLYLFIDEWPSVVQRYPHAGDYLVDVLQRGRAVDVCVDANAQGFLQDDVKLQGSARENFNTAFHMGGNGSSGARLLDLPLKEYNAILKQEQIALGQGVALLRNNESVPQAELVRLPYADNAYIYYMLGRADTWMLPEFRQRQEYSNVQEPAYQSSSNDTDALNGMNGMNEPVKLHEYAVNIQVSDEERAAILAAAQTQLRMTGKIIRTRVRDDLGWNNAMFPKIKQVLDEYEERDA